MADFDHQNHNYLFLDIETIPSGESNFEEIPSKADYILNNMQSKDDLRKQVPKSYKKEETIDKWIGEEFIKQRATIEENYQKLINECDAEYRGRSLNSLKGRIFCISYAYNNTEVKIVNYDPNEKRMLEKFQNALETDIGKRDIYSVVWVGHNIKKFDIRWIAHRAMKYGLKGLLSYIPTGKFDKRIMDTNDMFNLSVYGCYDKLDHIAKFFGLDGKVGMDGSQVYDYFLENKYEEIHKYCMEDVELTRAIFNKMNI